VAGTLSSRKAFEGLAFKMLAMVRMGDLNESFRTLFEISSV
jgi:hypothetical protein